AEGDAIEGFASVVSAVQGEKVQLFVSTGAKAFHVEAYRMGSYGGKGGRLVWTSEDVPGTRQAPAKVTPGVNLVEAPWTPSLVVSVDKSWPPGCYLLKLVAPAEGVQRWIPLTVRDDASHSAFYMMNAVSEWQAYNEWGGYSLYYGRGRAGRTFDDRGRIVSYDRPYDQTGGAGDFVGLEFPLVQLLEGRGYDVSYTTSVDFHRHPELVLQHRALLSPGHDEYWSKPMRDGAEAARDGGVNLAFFGANAAYRQIRFEPSALGPERHQVCYKSAREDPMRASDASLVTVNWRDAPVNRPEDAMIGQQYECNPVSADMVITDPGAWVFEGTGVTAGQTLPGAIGPEYDRYVGTPEAPKNVQILAHSPVTCHGKASFSDMTYYTAPSGAGVFASGSIWWITKATPPGPASPYDAVAAAVTDNVLRVFGAGPAGKSHPSIQNATAAA
ncbi:MAG TPA: N,N-dimethylformamidase beta subunit family domain-containing protein, partial [Acidimicrobiia bacterium]|nr:N,N-dimethylformamidase beta subunit family domain-containing protein [Acidimicrobiia bacterium]